MLFFSLHRIDHGGTKDFNSDSIVMDMRISYFLQRCTAYGESNKLAAGNPYYGIRIRCSFSHYDSAFRDNLVGWQNRPENRETKRRTGKRFIGYPSFTGNRPFTLKESSHIRRKRL